MSNIKITKYFNYRHRFNGIFSRDNLTRIKNETFIINIDDKQSIGAHWVSLFTDRNTTMYFDSLSIEYIPQEVLIKIKDKSITHNIFRIPSDDSIM